STGLHRFIVEPFGNEFRRLQFVNDVVCEGIREPAFVVVGDIDPFALDIGLHSRNNRTYNESLTRISTFRNSYKLFRRFQISGLVHSGKLRQVVMQTPALRFGKDPLWIASPPTDPYAFRRNPVHPDLPGQMVKIKTENRLLARIKAQRVKNQYT